jgi:hypothetical protein
VWDYIHIKESFNRIHLLITEAVECTNRVPESLEDSDFLTGNMTIGNYHYGTLETSYNRYSSNGGTLLSTLQT